MIKDVPLNKFVIDRAYVPLDDDVTELAESMATHGLQHPVLATTDWKLIDGLRRLLAAQKLGWSTLKCEVTNDYLRMLDNVAKTHTQAPPYRRLLGLYTSLSPYGDSWATKARGDYRTGLQLGYRPTSYPGEVEQGFGHRKRFSAAFGFSERYMNEVLEFKRQAERAVAVPGLAPYVEEVTDVIHDSHGETIGVSGGRALLVNLMKMPLGQVPTSMARWRRRQDMKVSRAVRIEAEQKAQQIARAAAVSTPADLRETAAIVSMMEGMALGVRNFRVPEMSEEVRKQFGSRLVAARREVNRFIKIFTQEGTDQ